MKPAAGKPYVVAHTAFTAGETLAGLGHIFAGALRVMRRRPADFFLGRYAQINLPVSQSVNRDGLGAICPICGYAMIEITVKDGWIIEMCSGAPVIAKLSGETFDAWVNSLPSKEVPLSRVKP